MAKLLGTPTGGLHHIDDPPLTVSISRFVDISIDMEEFVAGARQQLDDCIQQLPRIITDKCEQAEDRNLPVPRPLLLMVDVSRFGAFGAGIGPFAI